MSSWPSQGSLSLTNLKHVNKLPTVIVDSDIPCHCEELLSAGFDEVVVTAGVVLLGVVFTSVVETAVVEDLTGVGETLLLQSCQAELDAATLLAPSSPRLSTAALRAEPARPNTMRAAFMLTLCIGEYTRDLV